jgi:rhodanese-related sulfurtransferase
MIERAIVQKIKANLLADIIGAFVVATVAFLIGWGTNTLRSNPLPWTYVTPQKRLVRQVNQIGVIVQNSLPPMVEKDVSLGEMKRIYHNSSCLILDARPEIFYKVSHIPSAKSLPRDDFVSHYQDLQNILAPFRGKELVVYCSGSGCEDSQMTADALRKLGYTHVRVFSGGWDEWDAAQLPEEKSNE